MTRYVAYARPRLGPGGEAQVLIQPFSVRTDPDGERWVDPGPAQVYEQADDWGRDLDGDADRVLSAVGFARVVPWQTALPWRYAEVTPTESFISENPVLE